MIEDNDLVDKRWDKIEIEEREWHLHWACEGRGAIKELFPSSSFIHKISCLDFSGLKGQGMLDSLFATYGVSIIPRETGLEDEKPRSS